jgi:anti-anti-sigma factor
MTGSQLDPPLPEPAPSPAQADHRLISARLPREVDAANQSRVSLDLLGALDAYAPQVSGLIIDMSQTKFIDSAGLRALLAVQARAAGLGTAVWLAAPSQEVRRFLSLVDITGRMPVFDSMDAAQTAWFELPEHAAIAPQRPLALLGA